MGKGCDWEAVVKAFVEVASPSLPVYFTCWHEEGGLCVATGCDVHDFNPPTLCTAYDIASFLNTVAKLLSSLAAHRVYIPHLTLSCFTNKSPAGYQLISIPNATSTPPSASPYPPLLRPLLEAFPRESDPSLYSFLTDLVETPETHTHSNIVAVTESFLITRRPASTLS
eukprot:TRINITY_DN6007_c0_g1_i1.p1 TRINITY_DN6007_c0_g1~~TRINITY_DN6007_c0_g1_i1.p1  ORF type:complete len:181 (+),score=19.33 TRINITY_DN6007_c0_g1_i1:37-543(+)